MGDEILNKYAKRVGYSESEIKLFMDKGHRIRQIKRIAKASILYSIEATVVKSRHCNSGHKNGQKIILDGE